MSTTLAPLLSRKLKKVLETRTDSPELLVSLSTLSTFYTSNSQQARRNLKSTIERRGLEINDDFLAASEEAQQVIPVMHNSSEQEPSRTLTLIALLHYLLSLLNSHPKRDTRIAARILKQIRCGATQFWKIHILTSSHSALVIEVIASP